MKSATLSCETFHERELGVNIANRLTGVINEYGIAGKLVCGCSDDGANVKKAFRDAGLSRICCFAHCLNTCVKDSFKMMETVVEDEFHFGFGAVMKKVSDLTTLMHRSTKAKKSFDACQKRLKPDQKPYKMVKDVDTRDVFK